MVLAERKNQVIDCAKNCDLSGFFLVVVLVLVVKFGSLPILF